MSLLKVGLHQGSLQKFSEENDNGQSITDVMYSCNSISRIVAVGFSDEET